MLTIAAGIVLGFIGIIAIRLLFSLITGDPRVPALGKGIGEGLRGFTDGMKGITTDEKRKP